MLGVVAWCMAQDRENVTQIISHYADTDSAKGISISFNGPSSIYPRTTLTLDSLVVLWDEYSNIRKDSSDVGEFLGDFLKNKVGTR